MGMKMILLVFFPFLLFHSDSLFHVIWYSVILLDSMMPNHLYIHRSLSSFGICDALNQ